MQLVFLFQADLQALDGRCTLLKLSLQALQAETDDRVDKVCIWTPDKDLAQCVRGARVVQLARRKNIIRDASGGRIKFGVDPEQIPDYLALVGDSADGFPGISGIGPKTAARLLEKHGSIDRFPSEVLGYESRQNALLFRELATLRRDAQVFSDVRELRWSGTRDNFTEWAERLEIRRIPSSPAMP